MALEINKIYQGDCRELLQKLDDNSIDCCITSPPYWSLRDYGIEPSVWDGDPECEHNFEIKNKIVYGEKKIRWQNQSSGNSLLKGKIDNPNAYKEWNDNKKKEIQSGFCSKCGAWLGCLGLEPTFELYIKHLADIYDLVKQKLKKSGTCWVNIGDTYSNRGVCDPSRWKSKEVSYRPSLSAKKIGLKPKCLCLIPQRFAIEMINRGWILRNVIIWQKPNCMPSSAKDRFTVDFEYVYFFTKNKKYYFEQQREPLQSDFIYSRNSAKGGIQAKNNPRANWKEGLTREEIKDYDGSRLGRNKRCVWTIPTQPNPEAHFATFNPELITPMIKAGCPEDGIVLDPFTGIGTTLYTAWNLGRNYIGFEISAEYCKIAGKMLKQKRSVFERNKNIITTEKTDFSKWI